MTTILSEVEGFTPVIDVIVDDLGPVPAFVYGVVWRYCQMEDGVCTAAMETLANRSGMSRKTVAKHVEALCKEGYLIDTTPGVKNKPHVYADAGRVKVAGLLEARQQLQAEAGQERPSLEVGRNYPPADEVGKNYPPRCVESSHLGGKKLPTKIPLQETTQDTKSASRADGQPPATFGEWQAMIQKTSNRPAALRRMFSTMFPDADLPDFGYVGKAAKTVGGAGRLAELMWIHSTRPPTGDVLRFLMGVAKKGGADGAHRGGRAAAGADYNTPTQEQVERDRAALRAHRERRRAGA